MPEINAEGVLDVSSVHQGVKARNTVKYGSAKEKMRAYKAAMRDFQTEYYEQVSVQCGLTRDGPKRRRLSRRHWMIEKDAAKRLASVNDKNQRIESALSFASNISDKLQQRDINLRKRERKLALIIKNLSKRFGGLKQLKKYLNQKNNNVGMR
ncbi:hypothetical protein [Vibrio gazogenes]|nr:hypothetical protein [Vibrio gazogenes]USP12833.1 hypothetical protein MKS89_10325 [Vibrio gazogenes]